MAQGTKRGSVRLARAKKRGKRTRRRIRNERFEEQQDPVRDEERSRPGGGDRGKDSNGESVHLPGVLFT